MPGRLRTAESKGPTTFLGCQKVGSPFHCGRWWFPELRFFSTFLYRTSAHDLTLPSSAMGDPNRRSSPEAFVTGLFR